MMNAIRRYAYRIKVRLGLAHPVGTAEWYWAERKRRGFRIIGNDGVTIIPPQPTFRQRIFSLWKSGGLWRASRSARAGAVSSPARAWFSRLMRR
jgi:hypothetical protein